MRAAATSEKLTLAQANAMDQAAFVGEFGGIFEHSPWIAEAAWEARPFASADALHAAMVDVVRRAPRARCLEFLNGHPELAGKEAEAGTMTSHSTLEQRGRGVTAMTRDELVELRRLNAAYRQRHGFPFIIAVLDHSRAEILEAVRSRTERDTEAEIDAALEQIAAITRRRLRTLLPDEAGTGRAELVTSDEAAEEYLLDSIRLAMGNVRERKTWPFGAVITRGGEVVARAVNQVEALCDPSAHAEMQAVRAAAKALKSTDLRGCTVYASGYPCPMCLTAMYLAGVERVYFAYSNEDGEPYDLSAERGYVELARPLAEREMKLVGLPVRDEGEDLYEAWKRIG